MSKRFVIYAFALVCIFQIMASDCHAAGHYSLAYWREIGKHENSGNRSMYVHVFDEAGNPKPNVQLRTTWGVLIGETDANGYREIPIDPNVGGYNMICVDAQGSTSDVAYTMTSRRWPEWGHYSYNLAFMYKSNPNNPGVFDTDLVGTVNTEGSSASDAPATKSLAYYSTNALNRESDGYSMGTWSGFHGQTFVANANRIVAAKIKGSTGFGNRFRLAVQILAGGPNGTPIGPVRVTREMISDEYHPVLATWGVNDVQVIPGQTYFLKAWKYEGGGMNAYVVGNNYPNGTLYHDYTSYPGNDLMGLVVAMDYGVSTVGAISGTVRNSANQPLAGASVTTSPGNYTATSQSYGYYTIPGVEVGTYSVTASRTGYQSQTHSGVTVTAGQATVRNFNLSLVSTIPIATAKGLSNNSSATLRGIVTAVFPVTGAQQRFYIQNSDRSSGIAIISNASVSLGDDVLVQGDMGTVSGERVFNATGMLVLGTGLPISEPVSMVNRSIGGGSIGLQSAVVNNSASNTYATDVNNIGLLTTTWGKVTYVDSVGAFFYMDDGSDLNDGSGHAGIRVASSGLPTPGLDSNVGITGISGTITVSGKVARLLRPRMLSDLSYAAYLHNHLTNPSFETGTLAGWTSYGAVDGIQSGSWFGGIAARSGSYFLGTAASYSTKNGGVYQQVTGTVPGRTYRLSAWVNTFNEGSSNPANTNNRIGINPNGGTNPGSPDIVWSNRTSTQYQWQLIDVSAVAEGNTMTVFLEHQQISAVEWNINCFDDTALYMVSQ